MAERQDFVVHKIATHDHFVKALKGKGMTENEQVYSSRLPHPALYRFDRREVVLRRGHVNCGDAFGIHHTRSHQVLQVKSERVLHVCSFQLGMKTMRHFKEERIDEDVRVDEDDLFRWEGIASGKEHPFQNGDSKLVSFGNG